MLLRKYIIFGNIYLFPMYKSTRSEFGKAAQLRNPEYTLDQKFNML